MTDKIAIERETLERVLECLVQEGRSLRAAEVREALEQRADPPSMQPLQNCFDALETVTKHFTRTPSTLRDSQVLGMAHAAMKECHAAMTEAALQKISDFGQDQAMTPDVLISKLANLRLMAAARHVPEVDLVTIDLAIEHLRYFSATPLQRLSDARMDGIYNAWRDMGDDVSYGDLMRMVEAATYEAVDAPGDADEHVCAWSMDQVAKGWWK